MEEIVKREEFNVFSLMDRLDDDLIIQELEGRLPGILTYHFSDKGQEVWGLSKSGVDEATNELARKGEVIREMDLLYTLTEDEGFFICKAGRFAISKDGKEVLLDTKTGTKRQPKKTVKRDGSKVENPFWFEQGSIKACRNAASRLIPAAIKEGVIEYAKSKGKVKEIKKPDPPTQSSEPDPQTEEQPTPPKAKGTIISVEDKISKKSNKPYWEIVTNTGKYWTHDKEIIKLAVDAKQIDAEMEWVIDDKGKMTSLEVAK